MMEFWWGSEGKEELLCVPMCVCMCVCACGYGCGCGSVSENSMLGDVVGRSVCM